MTNNLLLRPIHYASVSGGKDSFFMLNLILQNPHKYPLDIVVHFELDIDWGWSKRVIDMMEERCKAVNIPFLRIKPRKSWDELYEKYGFPNAKARWCNSEYKLDCKKQLNEWIKSQNCRPLAYIGLCADEKSRFQYEIGDWENQDICYPLAEEGIEEDYILMWAKTQPIFEGYYRYFRRQGCKMCPFLSMKEMAYLLKTEPQTYENMVALIKETEIKYGTPFKKEGIDVIDKRVRNKWTNILDMDVAQISLFDYFAPQAVNY